MFATASTAVVCRMLAPLPQKGLVMDLDGRIACVQDLTSSEQSVQQVVDMASTHRPQAQATDASTASVPDFSNTRESVQEDTATSGPSYSWHSHTLDGNDVGHGWQVNSIPIREKSIDDYA